MVQVKAKRNSGFTLIELMLAMVISLFLIGGMVLLQSSAKTSSMESQRLSRVQENIRFNSDFLVREMRNAGFRDQLSLTIAEFDEIGGKAPSEGFAVLNDPDGDGIYDEVTLKYSGRGSCAEGFLTGGMLVSGLVENRYFVDKTTGELKCEGSTADGASRTVALATGIKETRFELMCPAHNPDCDCTLWVHGDDFRDEEQKLADTCYGIRIGLLLDTGDNDSDPVPIELSATFRNIVLGRLMWESIPDNPS